MNTYGGDIFIRTAGDGVNALAMCAAAADSARAFCAEKRLHILDNIKESMEACGGN